MDALIEAVAFLTVLPLGRRGAAPGRRSLIAFPVVGLLVGSVWVGIGWAGYWLWGGLPAAALVILADIGLTGGLHIDAVADLADGWASRKSAEAALEVMRDPAIGAVGAAVLGATLLARWSLLAVLIGQAAPAGHWWLLLVPPVVSRTSMVLTLGTPLRRRPPGESQAASLTDALAGAGWGVPAAAVGIAAVIAGLAGGWRGLLAVVLGAGLAELAARWATRRFGRLTGDTVGAAGIAAEIVTAAVLTARG
ncbi:MAG TPA: adenosylcobinamide-GDP ribazoletransferase [Actinomycetota bacterium]|nr:adenosylcobinamide-GDP ribazoletransferase [Actinomycetota bacterium]